ncbi:MAG: hypothetical protein Q7R77_00105 [Candidatus Daviesbacteria bacterium]|nr:hypothetical protein [Candidatus Daviesbacteria bacterium]
MAYSWVQHGGFLVDNNQGKVFILDYKRFIAERNKNLRSGEYAIEANWYMDSEHQEEVCARKNLQETRPYNCLGIFEQPDGHKRYFVVTATWANHLNIRERLGYERDVEHRNLTIRHVAAMANILANMYGAKRWAMGGLEFNSGDVCFKKERQLCSYFAGYFQNSSD